MAPCSGNVITPKMIRKGQVQIGDKIEFENSQPQPSADSVPANAPVPEAVPAASSPQPQNGTEPGSGIWLRPQSSPVPESYINQKAAFQANTAALPLIYQNMTDYVNSLENNGQQSPSFTVPSNPLVPPEYEQTIDYDSVQYMNGFLRTQIGRSMRVEQLIGSTNTVDRYGFLVGVGNNYLLMQDLYNGNVSLVDLYSVKYVYIYYSDLVYPTMPLETPGR